MVDGQEEAARTAFSKAAELAAAVLERNERDWVTLARLAAYNVFNGDIKQGLERITTAVAQGSQLYEVNYYDAVIQAHLGNHDRALDALERALELGSPVRMIARDPLFTQLRDDVRFRSLIENRGEE